MERDDGAQKLRRQDPRPWVGVGASHHDESADEGNGEHTAFRRLTSIAPGDTQPDFELRPTEGDPVTGSHLEGQPHMGGD